MKKYNLIIIASLIALTFFGCSDNSTSPDQNKSMFGMKTGSYWIYGNYTLDSLGNFEKNLQDDSVIVLSSLEWQSKQAFQVARYELNKEYIKYYNSFTADKFYISGEFITTFFDILPDMFQSKINIDEIKNKWCLIGDKSRDTFSMLDSPIILKDIKIPQYEAATINLTYNASVSKAEQGKYIDPMTNSSVNSIKFKLIHKIKVDLFAELPYIGKQTIPLDNPYITFEQYLTFAEGIGIVEGLTPTQRIKFSAKVPMLNQEYKIIDDIFDGGGFKLKRYKN